MIERIVVGEVPRKHHLQLRSKAGELRHEECITREGFDGPYSIVYHEQRPHTQHLTQPKHGFPTPRSTEMQVASAQRLAKRHYRAPDLKKVGGAPIDARLPLLFNRDVVIGLATPDREDPCYVVNADADDLFWVWKGGGVVRSIFGDLRFGADDYVCVPRGTVHRIIPDAVEQVWFSMECLGGVHLPSQWRNAAGQLRMDAPYSHRDFRAPTFVGPMDEGLRELVVKRGDVFHGFAWDHSPLDVVGWDGAVYPFAFNILHFQPRAGLVHLPPTWHGTFAARGALICSFVPRMVDFHPEAIPCPYPHSSVDCDEVLFYARGNFTSRRGVGPGSISYHPAGVAHGPHPGSYEKSIGTRETDELAVMLDTFEPLAPTSAALGVEDPNYQESFVK